MRCIFRSRISVWTQVIMLLGIFLFISNPTIAAITSIKEDLKPLNGYVVMAKNDKYIIDLDAKSGIAIGDVFTVLGKGEELIHPVTNKVIGKLEEVKGVLRVTRLSDGYSFAQPLGDLGDAAAIKRGDQIRRYAEFNAVFWDYTENQKPLFERLQKDLPALKWQDYHAAQKKRPAQPVPLTGKSDTLLFIVQGQMLEVRDAQLSLLRKYPITVTPSAASDAAASSGGKSIKPVAPQKSAAGTAVVAETQKPAMIDYGSADAVAQLSNNTLMADLLHHGSTRMLASTDGSRIRIYSMSPELQLLAETKARNFGQILAVKWWQPEATGLPYIAVLTWVDDEIDSTVYALENNRLRAVASGLDTVLGTFDLDNDGRPETLLSQKFDAGNFFGRRIKQLSWNNSQLQRKDPEVQLPPKFTVIGGQLADLTGDGKLEAAYVRNGILSIYSGKERLYVSPKHMGGSLSVLTYKIDPTLLDYQTTSVFFEIAPVAFDIDGDGLKELLAVSSDQSAIKAPGIITTIDQSRILVFNYEKGTFVKGSLGEPVDAAIQGLDVLDKQVIFVATETGSFFDREGSSRLQALNIAM